MGKDYLGKDMRRANVPEEKEEEKEIKALDEGDIALLKTYGQGPYSKALKQVETDISDTIKRVNELAGIKVSGIDVLSNFGNGFNNCNLPQESDTGLGPPALWDLAADKQTLQSEQPLQVARCTKIINADTEDSKYIINVKQFAKFVVDLAEQVASTDIEEGMRVGVDRNKYQVIQYSFDMDFIFYNAMFFTDSYSVTPQDRSFGDNDAGGRETRCHIQ